LITSRSGITYACVRRARWPPSSRGVKRPLSRPISKGALHLGVSNARGRHDCLFLQDSAVRNHIVAYASNGIDVKVISLRSCGNRHLSILCYPKTFAPLRGRFGGRSVDDGAKANSQSRSFRLVAQAFVPVQMSAQTRMSVPPDGLDAPAALVGHCHCILIVTRRVSEVVLMGSARRRSSLGSPR